MILIADGGSTKCDWLGVDCNGNIQLRAKTKGVNPSLLSKTKILKILQGSLELSSNKNDINKIYFYGAGCGFEEQQKALKEGFKKYFTKANEITVKEDLAAAVHSCTKTPAIVCILGTGSNCCFYNGNEIITRMPPMGFTLMDDASGNFIGKQLLRAYYFNQMPEHLAHRFSMEYNPNPVKVKKKLYKKANVNAYLSSFARFLFDNIEEPFMKALLEDALKLFVKTHLMLFKEELKNYPVHFVGSIAFFAKEQIKELLKEQGFIVGEFIQKPVYSLVNYHISKK
ncbi:N-acetylglucosamine kinase [Flavivirga sp. 57AJ16]|uniref:N-acetylglucosamine kinase n=1 Tax=Flavivirga sp. 57AJ16 TaxID=3025307 RepID=UPI0023651A8C|nr:N-acetylglucosamine kinase [Flavivirga sp. 57AJ16]MDD7886271.1 N-acetylglucosamine kinase [Flavivirga sp. 57AJ16]